MESSSSSNYDFLEECAVAVMVLHSKKVKKKKDFEHTKSTEIVKNGDFRILIPSLRRIDKEQF